jgi:hypothetical protein
MFNHSVMLSDEREALGPNEEPHKRRGEARGEGAIAGRVRPLQMSST